MCFFQALTFYRSQTSCLTRQCAKLLKPELRPKVGGRGLQETAFFVFFFFGALAAESGGLCHWAVSLVVVLCNHVETGDGIALIP